MGFFLAGQLWAERCNVFVGRVGVLPKSRTAKKKKRKEREKNNIRGTDLVESKQTDSE